MIAKGRSRHGLAQYVRRSGDDRVACCSSTAGTSTRAAQILHLLKGTVQGEDRRGSILSRTMVNVGDSTS